MGSLWFEYKSLGRSAILFNEFYNRTNEKLLLLRNYPNVGELWKNIEDFELASEFYLDIFDLTHI